MSFFRDKIRTLVQIAATAITNAHFSGFITGKIYSGALKNACVPGLNCYSCPGAIGSCPIGAMQAVIGGRKHNISFYIAGTLLLFGTLFGRFVCGFLCPFGFIQDLLYKIPAPRLKIARGADRIMRYFKYAVLLIMVILLPTFLTDEFALSQPYFCKWICPAGTLEGAVPLLLLNPSLRASLGPLFWWKFGLMILIILSSIFIYRPFCKYLCPLGAVYSLFNKVSFVRMHVDAGKCTNCGACEKSCKMNVDIRKNINSAECIRCGKCRSACPTGAISWKRPV